MIDWLSVKTALDETIGIEPVGKQPPRPLDLSYRSDRRLGPLKDDQPLAGVNYSKPFNYTQGEGTWFSNINPASDPVMSHTMRRDRIRPLLYNDPAREQIETARAYANRYKRLLQLARTKRDRENVWAHIKAGHIPPIVMRGFSQGKNNLKLTDSDFIRPDESIQTTFATDTNTRSYAKPFSGTAYIGANRRNQRQHNREEWAHLASPTSDSRKSVVDRMMGGDDFNYYKGTLPGGYELDPAELNRLVLLQKAAAANLGYPAFRTVPEWYAFAKSPYRTPINGKPFPNEKSLNYPYSPNATQSLPRLDDSTYSNQLMKTFDNLRRIISDPKTPQDSRQFYIQQYNQLYNAIQDAIDMAAVKRNSNVLPA